VGVCWFASRTRADNVHHLVYGTGGSFEILVPIAVRGAEVYRANEASKTSEKVFRRG